MTTSSNNINLEYYQPQNTDFGRPQSIGANDALMRNNDSRPMLNMQTWTNNHVSQTPSTTNLLGGFSDESRKSNTGYPQSLLQRTPSLPLNSNHGTSNFQRTPSLPVDRNHRTSTLGMGGNHNPEMENANSLLLPAGSWDNKISNRSMPASSAIGLSQQRSAVPGATTINNQVDYWNVDSRQQYNVNTASSGSTNNVGGIHSNYNDNFLLSVSAPVNGMPQGHSNRSANSLPEEVAASIFSNSSMFANAGSFVEQ